MNSIVSEITKSITGKTSLLDCSTDELKQITSQYPYFAPAQFLYVKKLKDENSSQLAAQKQKALLYYQNHVWLDYLLHENITVVETESISEEKAIIEKTEEEAASIHAKSENPTTFEEVVHQPEEPVLIEKKIGAETISEKKEEEVSTLMHEELETPASFKEVVDHAPVQYKEPVLNEEKIDAEIIPEKKEEEAITLIHAELETPATFEEVVVQTHDQPGEPVQVEKEPEPVSAEPAPVEHLITQFKFQPIDSSKAAMIFEPYHTVDYFASQGIKPKEEEKPKDRFTQQLKSFTEWLKVMKRLPVSEIAAAVSSTDEKKVEQMAAVSINDREVVTEAMAEVWEKQGNHVKAIETYEKLSLLNPDKNSFFAAKIEHLKTL